MHGSATDWVVVVDHFGILMEIVDSQDNTEILFGPGFWFIIDTII